MSVLEEAEEAFEGLDEEVQGDDKFWGDEEYEPEEDEYPGDEEDDLDDDWDDGEGFFISSKWLFITAALTLVAGVVSFAVIIAFIKGDHKDDDLPEKEQKEAQNDLWWIMVILPSILLGVFVLLCGLGVLLRGRRWWRRRRHARSWNFDEDVEEDEAHQEDALPPLEMEENDDIMI